VTRNRSRVVVLGGTGMLGLTVVEHLADEGFAVAATSRDPERVAPPLRSLFSEYSVERGGLADVLRQLGPGDSVVNCVGLIKHHIDDNSSSDRREAVRVNSEFPYELANLAETTGFRIIQIATDCVFSGSTGQYSEHSPHDAGDVYGQSKSLGEVPSDQVLNLRCSIIGPELETNVSLLNWILSHPAGSSFSGYLDHVWNGVTTLAFARVVAGMLRTTNAMSGTVHLVPADSVNKFQLSEMVLAAFGRDGVTVQPTQTGNGIDRTLATIDPVRNELLWHDAGYSAIPTIDEMVRELAMATKDRTDGVVL
jgi:dTDP-4-dehydrorhamnose reductase